MKITSDLRLAIKSAHKCQPVEDHHARQARTRKVIADLLKRKPALARKIKAAQAVLAEWNNKRLEALKAFEEIGVNPDLNYLADDAKFFKAGGGSPLQEKHKRWDFDPVMTQLAAATEKEGKTILRRLGINWDN